MRVGRNPVCPNEERRSPSAQTARRAVTMDFPLTRIHHSQIALAVYDLASDRHSSQVANHLLNRGRAIHDSNGAWGYFYHCSAFTIDQLAL